MSAPDKQCILAINGYKRPVALLKRIAYWEQYTARLDRTPYVNMRMLVLAPSENEICRDLFHSGLARCLNTNILFVTLNRSRKNRCMRQYSYLTSLVTNITLRILICGTYFMKMRQYRPYENKTRRG